MVDVAVAPRLEVGRWPIDVRRRGERADVEVGYSVIPSAHRLVHHRHTYREEERRKTKVGIRKRTRIAAGVIYIHVIVATRLSKLRRRVGTSALHTVAPPQCCISNKQSHFGLEYNCMVLKRGKPGTPAGAFERVRKFSTH